LPPLETPESKNWGGGEGGTVHCRCKKGMRNSAQQNSNNLNHRGLPSKGWTRGMVQIRDTIGRRPQGKKGQEATGPLGKKSKTRLRLSGGTSWGGFRKKKSSTTRKSGKKKKYHPSKKQSEKGLKGTGHGKKGEQKRSVCHPQTFEGNSYPGTGF